MNRNGLCLRRRLCRLELRLPKVDPAFQFFGRQFAVIIVSRKLGQNKGTGLSTPLVAPIRNQGSQGRLVKVGT